jgi:hypothetical protein
MSLYPRSVVSQEHAPTPFPSIVFTFRLAIESIKELGGASHEIIFLKCYNQIVERLLVINTYNYFGVDVHG